MKKKKPTAEQREAMRLKAMATRRKKFNIPAQTREWAHAVAEMNRKKQP